MSLGNHRDPNAANPALLYKTAHGTQADFLAPVFCQLRCESVRFIDKEVQRVAVDAEQLAREVGGEPDLIFSQHQAHVENGRKPVLDKSRCQHPAGMRFKRSVGVIASKDDHRVPRSIAAGGRPQAPPCPGRINGRDLLLVAEQLSAWTEAV